MPWDPDQYLCFERGRAPFPARKSHGFHREAGEIRGFIDMLLTKLKPPELILDKGGIERLYEDRTTQGPTTVFLGGCGRACGDLGSFQHKYDWGT